MTDSELLQMYRTLQDQSVTTALRAIFNAGYATGAAVTPSVNMTDFSTTTAKPTDAVIATLKAHVRNNLKG